MSWGDPWSRAFEGVGRAFGNYYDNKERLQEKEEDRVYFEEVEKRKEAAAEKARQAREEAERNAGIVFEAFSPEGKLTTLTRGEMSGGAALPEWELERQRQAQLAAQAEAEASGVERQAKLNKLRAETGAASARAEASRARAAQQGLSRGDNASGVEKEAADTVRALLAQKQSPDVIYSSIQATYGKDMADKVMPGFRKEAERSMISTATRAVQGLARLFGAQPNKDDERAASILVK